MQVIVSASALQTESFFVAGGTLPLEVPSYVERETDANLLESLRRAQFCYVLNSRQMGKSSLCVRTVSRLEADGVRTVFIDLTRVGGKNVTPEQWYLGLLLEVSRPLGLRAPLMAYWKEQSGLSPMQRFFGAITEVALTADSTPLVVFIDEIDSTRSLTFDTDEFFAGIRELYNRRVSDPTLLKLTFCLLGVAIPSDLIQDPKKTPFNIGERIFLRDFTLQEAMQLAAGLGPNGERLLRRVFHWTNGHPFLTQSLCRTIAGDSQIASEADVDALVERDLLEPKARETNINLADVGNRVLNGALAGDDIAQYRADVLSAYALALKGKLLDDESNRLAALLKLSGLLRGDGKRLVSRNRIYAHVFGRAWIEENMPDQEMRRQRKAFYLGVARAAVVTSVLTLIVGFLAVNNARLAGEAQQERDLAQYEAYTANSNLAAEAALRSDLTGLQRSLALMAGSPHAGIEVPLFEHRMRLFEAESAVVAGAWGQAISPDGKLAALYDGKQFHILDAQTLREVRSIPFEGGFAYSSWSPDGQRLLVSMPGELAEIDYTSGEVVERHVIEGQVSMWPQTRSVDGDRLAYWLGSRTGVWDIAQRKQLNVLPADKSFSMVAFSPDGKLLAVITERGVDLLDAQTYDRVRTLVAPTEFPDYSATDHAYVLQFDPSSRFLAASTTHGSVWGWNVQTGKPLFCLKLTQKETNQMHWAPDSSRLSVVSIDRRAFILDVAPDGSAQPGVVLPETGTGRFGPTRDDYYSHYWTLRRYDLSKYRDPILYRTNVPESKRVTSEGTRVFLASQLPAERTFTAVDVLTGKVVTKRFSDLEPLGFVDGAPWAVSSSERRTEIWDFDSGKLLHAMEFGLESRIKAPAARLDAGRFVVGTPSNLTIVNLATGAAEVVPRPHPQIETLYLAVSPDATRVAVAGDSGNGAVLDLASRQWRTFRLDLNATAVRFSPDGSLLIVATGDETIRTFDAASLEPRATFRGHLFNVTALDATKDGKRLLSVSDDGTARLWDLKTGRQVALLQDGQSLYGGGFIDSGRAVFTVEQDGEVRLYPTAGNTR
jgi:WD40 repeat protein